MPSLRDLLNVGRAAAHGYVAYQQAEQEQEAERRRRQQEDADRAEQTRLRALEAMLLDERLQEARTPRFQVEDGQVVPEGGFTSRGEADSAAAAQRAQLRRQRMYDNNREVLQAGRVAEATARGRAAGGPAEMPGGGDPSGLRKEFGGDPTVRDAGVVTASYRTIRQLANAPATGANDLGLIFSYMKMLDPGSTVREGEFANAENAQGIPDRIRSLYNRALNGERLAPETRQEFVASAEQIAQSRYQSFQPVHARYTDLATRGGYSPADVVFDPFTGLVSPPATTDTTGLSDEEIWARVMNAAGR